LEMTVHVFRKKIKVLGYKDKVYWYDHYYVYLPRYIHEKLGSPKKFKLKLTDGKIILEPITSSQP